MDPAARLDSCRKHVLAASQLITEIASDDNRAGPSTVKRLDRALSSVVGLLEADQKDEPTESASPCLQLMLSTELLVNLTRACLPNSPAGARCLGLKTLGDILRRVRQEALVTILLLPLDETLVYLQSHPDVDPAEDYQRVVLLNELCARFLSDPRLLAVFFDGTLMEQEDRSNDNLIFPVFSGLIGYMHELGGTGQLARDSLLMCITKLSHLYTPISRFIAERSNFGQVLVSWLTACFAALPPKLKKAVIDWRMQSTDAVPEITAYLSCLDFCGAVTNAGDPIVVRQLIGMISSKFILPVFRPRLLLQSPAEALAATAYLQLSIARVGHPDFYDLATPFVDVVLDNSRDLAAAGQPDTVEILLRRLDVKKSDLPLATLRLFITLLGLNRQDVFFHLCVKNLYADARATLSVVSPQVDPSVAAIHAARAFLRLRPGPYESAPGGPDFGTYIAEARASVRERAASTREWPEQYTIAALQAQAEKQSSIAPGGLMGGLRWAMSKAVPLQQGQCPGFWGAVMTKLRAVDAQTWKFNLLLSELIATLAQCTPPMWTAFVFSLSTSRSNPAIPTLYGVLADLAFKAGEHEQHDESLAAGLADARAGVSAGKRRGTPEPVRRAKGSLQTPGGAGGGSNDSLGAEKAPPMTPPTAAGARGVGITTPKSATSSWWGSTTPVASPVVSDPLASPLATLETPSGTPSVRPGGGGGKAKAKQKEIHAVLLLEELLKELAAIALEQAMAQD